MIQIGVQVAKYLNVLLLSIYILYSFLVLIKKEYRIKRMIYRNMTGIVYIFHLICFVILYLVEPNMNVALLYGGQVIGITVVLFLYQKIYPNLSKSILLHMIFLFTLGNVVLTRLSLNKFSFDKVIQQSLIVGLTLISALIIPLIMDKFTYLSKFGWIYGAIGICALMTVFFFGIEQYGARNWIRILGFSFQPSEFVKILFVFAIAGLFNQRKDFKYIVIVTMLAAVHVLILVSSRDLGGALIYFITYLVMLYIATKNSLYFFAGLIGGGGASVIAYHLFDHIKVRMIAWSDPWSYIDSEGYQITQSLFAIGTGGWFGMGLTKGVPQSIPIVESDFIFSAIAEEFGVLFSILLIFIFMNLFMVFIMMTVNIEDEFYKLIGIGLATTFMFQVFLSIGGVIKFIPLTGVTLPLISYGGSSVLSTVLMLSIMQGLHVYSQDRIRKDEKRREKQNKKREKQERHTQNK